MSTPALYEALATQGHGFAVFPEARIYKAPASKTIQHLLFGDYITPPKSAGGKYKKWSYKLLKKVGDEHWVNVRSRQEEGWMRLSDIQLNRVLEVNFVDIGQGDGCHLVTPDDCHFIIDAGAGDNMYRFLRWRFNLKSAGKPLPKFFGIISHPDEDHWKGFEPLLSRIPSNQVRQIVFEKLYHNGIVQRTKSALGKTIKVGDQLFLSDFIDSQEKFKIVLYLSGKKSQYETLWRGAFKNFPDLKIEAVWKDLAQRNFLYKDDKLTLEVLAPIPEMVNGELCLRWFDKNEKDIGKTKNGHSVVLMAHIGKMKIMLGGDLNSKSADHLMEQYSKRSIKELKAKLLKSTDAEAVGLKEEMREIINLCRPIFQSEVAKCCHHGSHDITNEFLQVVNPIATVISSGDEESFCHPRPETLGAIGKYGRGERPLIFSTELARSSPEYLKLKGIDEPTEKDKQRLVSTYGLITVRTDGEKAIIAQKLEKGRSQFGLIVKWHIDKLIWNDKRQEFVTSLPSVFKTKKKTLE